MTAAECQAAGFVSRVFPAQDLERETRAAVMFMPGFSTIAEDSKRLRAVDLAVRGRRGERYGQDGTQHQT